MVQNLIPDRTLQFLFFVIEVIGSNSASNVEGSPMAVQILLTDVSMH